MVKIKASDLSGGDDATGGLTSVIGRTVLSAIHHDMEHVQLPSWLQAVSKSFGTASHGKLSADEWRVACTIHIPFTLIRLWGPLDEGERKRKMLDNFMQLIRAVDIAGSLRISEDEIVEYETTMLDYLIGMRDLYKEASMKPNHHIALHLGEFLRGFGPVPAWQAFGFERFNYLLQNTNTNKKSGKSCFFYPTQTDPPCYGTRPNGNDVHQAGLPSSQSSFSA